MTSHFSITRFSITARNRVAYIVRRNFVTEAVQEGFAVKRKAVEEHAKCTLIYKFNGFLVCYFSMLNLILNFIL